MKTGDKLSYPFVHSEFSQLQVVTITGFYETLTQAAPGCFYAFTTKIQCDDLNTSLAPGDFEMRDGTWVNVKDPGWPS